jgi:pyruvate kinase
MPRGADAHRTIRRAACFAAQDGDRPLVVFSWSGASAIYASKARMRTPIYALTPKQNVVDELALVWGITSVLVPPVRSVDDLLASGEQLLLSRGLVEPGQEVVMVVGQSPMEAASRLMKIHVIGR